MDTSLIVAIIGLSLILISADKIAKVLQKIKFPLITGFILTGVIAGSSLLNYIDKESLIKLSFLNDIALSIIAFSAGSELFLNDLRSRINSIKWMTIGQVITFVMTTIVIFLIADHIPFMREMSALPKIGVAILFGTIFVARSPSSAIAIINEMRANGSFTKTVMGVTVVTDVLVIILFAICFSLAKAFIHGGDIGFLFLGILALELIASFVVGYLVGKILQIPFNLGIPHKFISIFILIIGYGVYILASFVDDKSSEIFHHGFVIEPLLICIIGSFVLTNYSKHRVEFSEILEDISPYIYIVFFTLVGASLSIPVMISVFGIALTLFFFRAFTMLLGGIFGVVASGDDKKYTFVAWMPYLTQAGVALGLATIISNEFPTWGHEFEAIIIAIIVINQLVGPPVFKWVLNFVGESHIQALRTKDDTDRDAIIFGAESQSFALARQLTDHKWNASIICTKELNLENENINYTNINDISTDNLKTINLSKAESIILMLSDEENLQIANYIYENIGTKDVIVRLNSRDYFKKFHDLDALIIEPATAIVSLLDHFVRSPNATSLLMGMDETQDTMDVIVRNTDIHGMQLRDLHLPSGIIILSVKRSGQMIISHGYTRLRMGDIVTLVGKINDLEEINTRFS